MFAFDMLPFGGLTDSCFSQGKLIKPVSQYTLYDVLFSIRMKSLFHVTADLYQEEAQQHKDAQSRFIH